VKVVYKSVEKSIREAILKADSANRTIDHILLSPAEANEIADRFNKNRWVPMPWLHYTEADSGKEIGYVYGVRLIVA
jgi:hypothetical protein